ncbi:MAG: hypothetical protein HZB37_08665 [Planctomycetes bacterium]|nr:hypothetical protein [Planctomycetota bacterium]
MNPPVGFGQIQIARCGLRIAIMALSSDFSNQVLKEFKVYNYDKDDYNTTTGNNEIVEYFSRIMKITTAKLSMNFTGNG